MKQEVSRAMTNPYIGELHGAASLKAHPTFEDNKIQPDIFLRGEKSVHSDTSTLAINYTIHVVKVESNSHSRAWSLQNAWKAIISHF
jgi:hypothetical protein